MQNQKKNNFLKSILTYGSFIFGIISILYVLCMWNKMPQQIPSHYNISGVADQFGGKGGCIVIILIQCLLIVMMRAGGFLTRAANNDGKKKTEKQEQICVLIENMLAFETAFISLCFTYIIYSMVNGNNLGSLFMIIFMIGMLLPIGIYIIFAYRIGR